MFIMFADILAPALIGLGSLGALFGVILAVAAIKFRVEVNPKVEQIFEALPGANCGACGKPGCLGFAEALVKGDAEPNGCAPGGSKISRIIAEILGIEVQEAEKHVALIHCAGGNNVGEKYIYDGIPTCKAATMIAGGHVGCGYGCLSFYDCIESCRFDAIEIRREDGLPVVDPEKCVACGACLKACPKNLIDFVPAAKKVHVMCSNPEKGKAVSSVCKIGCIGCTRCTKSCTDEAFYMEEGLARIDYSKSRDCAEAVKSCPVNVIFDFSRQNAITWLPPISEVYPKPQKKAAVTASGKTEAE